jgi:hypothetical protein
MLYSKIIAVCSEIHTKHINTLCGQNVEFVNVKRGGTYSNHWALKGSYNWSNVCLAHLMPVTIGSEDDSTKRKCFRHC